jgi:hypothetical protein
MSFLLVRQARAASLVFRLENNRTEWMARYIEWQSIGCAQEARVAFGHLVAVRRQIARALRTLAFWRWLAK